MFPRNPERERDLLAAWWAELTVRQASFATGIPEGTVSRYYARFNKNLKGQRRQEDRAPPSEGSADSKKTLRQLDKTKIATEFGSVQETFYALVRDGKYAEAKSYIEAVITFQRYRSGLLSTI